MASNKERVLAVDDEPRLLSGLSRQLRGYVELVTANGPAEALEILEREPEFAVVICDLRMPGMDGVTFLGLVRERSPDSVRVLLTGQADMDAAVAAVNQGGIFRFLTKPCPPDQFRSALDASLEQYRLITAERVLLEQTLHGSIQTLTDALALSQPAAFSRGLRAQQHVRALMTSLGVADTWPCEVAAMLSQLGCVTLPPETVDKLHRGARLSLEEQTMVDRLPQVAERLLGSIPRLEPVLDILRFQSKHYDGEGPPAAAIREQAIPWGARALKLVLDADMLEARGLAPPEIIETLGGRSGWYNPAILAAFAELHGTARTTHRVECRALAELGPGMVLAEDLVVASTGVLLVARGQKITESLIERLRNMSHGSGLPEPLRLNVLIPSAAPAAKPEPALTGA